MKKSGKLSPVILVIAGILLVFKIVDLFSLYSRVFQTGGQSSIEALVTDYQDAINDGDAAAYLKLVPKSERTSAEKKHIKEKIGDYSGKNYKMSVGASIEKEVNNTLSTTAKLFLLDPFGASLVNREYSVSVNIETDEGTYKEILYVLQINGKYYIDDVDVL